MLQNVKDTILTALSFLRSDKAPPNITVEDTEKMKAINHMTSSKFYIVFTSVIILAFFYFTSVSIMFFIPRQPEFIAGFVTVFSKTIEILAIIIGSYVGAQAVVDLKYGSSSSATLNTTTETNKEVTVIHTNAKEEDYELI